jgi:SAM-dependent methyltransferase
MITLDRFRPRLFHQDYWPLVAIRQEVEKLIAERGERLRGERWVDFGAAMSPYAGALRSAGADVVPADLPPVDAGVLEIGPDGRVPLDAGSVDAVMSTQVLEHVPDVASYLSEARRLLKPGGTLFLTTHGTWYLHRVPTDMRRWTADGLRYDIERCGFAVERVVPRIGILATASHARMYALAGFLKRTRVLAPLRGVTNALFNIRMGIEEMLTSQDGRDALQQLLVVTAHAA